ncbi:MULTISPECIES: pyruvate, phosphate dikinase [Rhodobacterales]|uniref:pyruvate, phosphate dikinase n=1 Tax=Roseobacter sp. N2S TaxID=2663844 RepID=UPI002864999F|nr:MULTISPECIES: pyruvate, phosphate dikinase [Rhodobacterales]MDR6266232.1 pyruvate,orthophosphate dikinase [Roseobacter sp. N2S]
MADFADIAEITGSAKLPAEHYGIRAEVLGKLMAEGVPVPRGFAVSKAAVHRLAVGNIPDLSVFKDVLKPGVLYSVRRSPEERNWGGPRAMLNIGMCDKTRDVMARDMGLERANDIYSRFIRSYAQKVARLDEDDLEELVEAEFTNRGRDYGRLITALLEFYEDELDEPFPQDPMEQMRQVLRAVARMWEGTTARILRQARGAPMDAGLGLIVQDMVAGTGAGECGVGSAQFTSLAVGSEGTHGRYISESQGNDSITGRGGELFLGRDARGPSVEDVVPEVFAQLKELTSKARGILRDEIQIQFSVQDGAVWVLDARPADRSGRAEVEIAVQLVKDGLHSKEQALLSVTPGSLTEMLHRQIDPKAKYQVLTQGIAASPGANSGKIVFSAEAAQASAAQGENCILVRSETSPEDIRGMHSAQGILTERGGITSHAAVIARGLGLPCIVGASEIDIDLRRKRFELPDGRKFCEGDVITLDGASGEVIAGAPDLIEPDLSGAFNTLLDWTDEFRKLGVRANADTPSDARLAQTFRVDGIGLCRTEHMFFEPGRLTAMREMIFADQDRDRQAALDRLLPMQRADFVELFETMVGLPVCIRLLDPPLHEFLPQSSQEIRSLAEAMDLPLAKVMGRAEDLKEYNPMLGMRGVRLGLTVPGIYDMQARAIFEAAAQVQKKFGTQIKPEIMVPLVSANKEVEIVKGRVDVVAAEVQMATGQRLEYSVGVMVETPRAALKAGQIAQYSEFLSFGTNDLTQMTYGLSRDDAGRFMRTYVNRGVFVEDPFHSIDLDGVGELLTIAVTRAKAARGDIGLGLCGEHGGDPASVAFCHKLGLDYVSCSPYRAPVARLAAAQTAIREDG